MEYEELKKNHIRRENERRETNLQKHSASIEKFKFYVESVISNVDNINFQYYDATGVIAQYPNILQKLNPKVKIDKEGLTPWSYLNQEYLIKKHISGFAYDSNYMIMPNQFFRRGFSKYTNYTPFLIRLIWKNDFENIDFGISLDTDMVRINVDDSMYMELDTWYGPKFTDDISSIRNGNTKLKPPIDIDEFSLQTFFSNTYGLDVKWSEYEQIKEIEIEEIKTKNVKQEINGVVYYPARYIHAEYDLEKKHFRHFDGAIHFYTEEEYELRKDTDLNFNDKIAKHIKANSNKLFKLNGSISKELFIEYSGNFLFGNPLFHEYIEGNLPQ